MKKVLTVIVAIVIMVGVVCGCVCWYKSATNQEEEKSQIEEVNENVSNEVINSGEEVIEKVANEPIFTRGDYPKVDASLAIHPLMDSIASDFMGVPEEDLKFDYTKTRTSDVYKNLVDGNVDVIFAAAPSEDDYEYAKSKDVELKVIPATSSAFVFIVNTKNPVDSLTLDEIVKIYKGEITNWKEVGGDDAEIIPYQRPNGSGSQTAMISLVMKDANLMTAPQMKIESEMGGLIDAVAEYDNSKDAIGYSYFYYVNTMYKRDTIKMVAVNGVEPTIETIKDGSYPIFTNGYIVIRENEPEDSSARKWVDAVLSERGSEIIEGAGYVPIN